MALRYEARERTAGTWMIWDLQDQAVAVVDGTPALNLTGWEARQVVGWLNHEPMSVLETVAWTAVLLVVLALLAPYEAWTCRRRWR